ncbi:unnamed protein product [Larinioides sclopetarius]|uniref:Uncharacterized protein n=1 Tax=Larinioides sclopetarius TaxID=280406 RepID=A0AAV1YZU2_9ARAC
MDLIAAAKMGNLGQVARLHSEGHSLMLKDHEGRTALHHAAFIGNVDVVRYLVAYECLHRCFYVDDFVSGTDSLQHASEISRQAVSIMKDASMVLRKWTTNSDQLMQQWKREGLETQLQDNSSTKVLGMMWNTMKDHLFVGIQSLVGSLSNNENTKRHLLRAVGKIFDPLGLLTPFTIRVKCILQVLWLKKISWDAELPPDIRRMWCQWVSEVPRLSEIEIPRYVLHSSVEEYSDVLELHCFVMPAQKLMVLPYIQEL